MTGTSAATDTWSGAGHLLASAAEAGCRTAPTVTNRSWLRANPSGPALRPSHPGDGGARVPRTPTATCTWPGTRLMATAAEAEARAAFVGTNRSRPRADLAAPTHSRPTRAGQATEVQP